MPIRFLNNVDLPVTSSLLKTDSNGLVVAAVAGTDYLTSITSAMVTTALGYTPVPTTRTLTINGTAFDLSANRTWTITTITGNAGSATVLQTARNINGTSFNGSADITTANWGTARTITIGNTGKSVNGSANVSWTLAEIGAYAATNPSGFITSSGSITGTAGALLREDNRVISPSELTAGWLKFGFTSWSNNNTSPWADFLHMRSYTDSSGGNDNLVMFLKSGIGMRIYQQTWGSTTAYSTFKDVAFTDSSITGNAATATVLATARTLTIGNTGKSFNGSADVSWTLAEIGAQAALTNPVTGTGTTNYLPKFTGATTIGNSQVFDNGTNVGIGTTSPDVYPFGGKLNVSGNISINGSKIGFGVTDAFSLNGIDTAHYGISSNFNLVQLSGYGGLVFATEGAERMRISGQFGNVGIANTSPIAGLDVQNSNGTFRQKNFTTMVTNNLGANGTQARRFEIARLSIDYNDWNALGTLEVELHERYYSRGLKKRYSIYYGYVSASGCNLVEMSGSGDNQFQVTLGPEVVISGDIRYIPVYVDVRYYAQVNAVLRTTRYLTNTNPPEQSNIWVNSNPAAVDISDFTADSTVYAGNIIGANTTFPTGNVGIGTTSPAYKLSVNGDASFGSYIYIASEGSGGVIGDISTGNYLRFLVSNGEKMRITSAGNVGIGTTSPAQRLDVSGTIRMSGTSTAANLGGIAASWAGSTIYPTLYGESADRWVMHINPHISYVQTGVNGFTGSTQGATIRFASNPSASNYWDAGVGVNSIGTDAFSIGRAGSAFFNINNAGRVGIGTTAPATQLQVSSATNAVDVFRIGNTAGDSGSVQGVTHLAINQFGAGTFPSTRITAYQDGVSGWPGGMYFSTRSLNTDSAPVERMRITSGGSVGIGTTGPLSLLHVAGDARITSGSLGVGVAPNATDGRIDASNDIVAFSTSDKRLKENVTPIENALEKVKTLTGVEFDWKEETAHVHGYHGHDVGIIAQDVQAVLPEAVRTNDSGYLSVRYEKMIALLIEAMKEQQNQIDELKAKLDGLTK